MVSFASFQGSSYLKKNVKGVYTPLLHVLSSDPQAPERVLSDEESLKISIQTELDILLNTRPTGSASHKEDYPLPHHFGLRDFSFEQAATESGRYEIAQEIRKAIQHYEPRLENVSVHLRLSGKDLLGAFADIQGDICFGTVNRRVLFPVTLTDLFRDGPPRPE